MNIVRKHLPEAPYTSGRGPRQRSAGRRKTSRQAPLFERLYVTPDAIDAATHRHEHARVQQLTSGASYHSLLREFLRCQQAMTLVSYRQQ